MKMIKKKFNNTPKVLKITDGRTSYKKMNGKIYSPLYTFFYLCLIIIEINVATKSVLTLTLICSNAQIFNPWRNT